MIECCKCHRTVSLYCPAKCMGDFKKLIAAEHWFIMGNDDQFICPECLITIVKVFLRKEE